ncbi:hypothetical protein D3C72_780490 [compost metagenome]
MIVGVQPSAPAVGDRGLLRFFERTGAPPVADQGLGFAALALLLQGAGQGDGALGGRRGRAVEEGQNCVRGGVGHAQGALARRPARITARPVGEVGLGAGQIGEGQLFVRGVDQGPFDQLPGRGVGNAAHDRLRADHVAGAGRGEPLLEQGHVLAADDAILAGGIGRRRAVQHVLGRRSQNRQGGGHGRRDHQMSDPHSSLVAAERRATYAPCLFKRAACRPKLRAGNLFQ